MPTFTTNDSHSITEEFGERWNRFWFTPADPLPASMSRIVVGLLAAAHFMDLAGDLSLWYAQGGALPPAAVGRLLELTSGDASYHYSYLDYLRTSGELWAVHGLAIIAALAFAVGLLTRISGALTLAAMLAYVHRAPQVAGHIEPVLSFLVLYLCIAPSGACLSLDQRLFGSLKKNSLLALLPGSCEPSVGAKLALRLIQVHTAMFYAMMGLTKLYGDAWWQGGAIWLLLAQTESRPLDLTGLRRAGQVGEYLLNFWTHAIIYFELAFPVLIWSRITRPILLALSIAIWSSLIVATGQSLFGLAMLATSIAFIPGERLRAFFGRRTIAAASLSAAA
jgi:uncharacterized membrane protein YphA (DoxX/SURF4 family)